METVDEPSSGNTKCLCLHIMSSSLKEIGCIKLKGKLFIYLFKDRALFRVRLYGNKRLLAAYALAFFMGHLDSDWFRDMDFN